jgi:hypothetical protein
MELKFLTIASAMGAGFRVAGSGSLQVIDWGDGKPYDQYEYFTGTTNTQTHAYDAFAGFRTANVFHNNDIGTLQFEESGFFYTATAKIVSVLGDLPDGMNTISIGNCTKIGTDNGDIAQIDLTNCPLIYYIQFINCTVLIGADTALLFPAPQPSLRFLLVNNCAFTSTNVDTFVNDFAVDSWNGTVGGGTINMTGGTSGAPTAASLTNRNLLLAATPAWTLNFNP